MFSTFTMIEWMEAEIATESRHARQDADEREAGSSSTPCKQKGGDHRRARLLAIYDQLTVLQS